MTFSDMSVFIRVCYFCSIFSHKVIVTATLFCYAFPYLPKFLRVIPPPVVISSVIFCIPVLLYFSSVSFDKRCICGVFLFAHFLSCRFSQFFYFFFYFRVCYFPFFSLVLWGFFPVFGTLFYSEIFQTYCSLLLFLLGCSVFLCWNHPRLLHCSYAIYVLLLCIFWFDMWSPWW